MSDYGALKLTDRDWCNACFRHSRFQGCEYNFTNALLWGDLYRQVVACRQDLFLARIDDEAGNPRFLYPAGEGTLEDKLAVIREESGSAPLQLIAATDPLREALDARWPGRFEYREFPGGADYVYSVDKLADLPGKHLHSKRNHIARFEEHYPDWRFEPVTAENLPDCCAMADLWYEENLEREPSLAEEQPILQYAFDHMEELELEGGLIRADGRVLAFTLGDFITEDSYDIHFEKAFGEIQGTYPIINREFVRYLRSRYPDLRWINRENDMDLEGLRKAKLSYHPDLVMKKYLVRER
ncbi:MAG: DUF2156 domain-containing protein [Oscillospiraceae bacterium]|nr:DUF2156 domain-containing protein [Oscillospiraceae bacterium]